MSAVTTSTRRGAALPPSPGPVRQRRHARLQVGDQVPRSVTRIDQFGHLGRQRPHVSHPRHPPRVAQGAQHPRPHRTARHLDQRFHGHPVRGGKVVARIAAPSTTAFQLTFGPSFMRSKVASRRGPTSCRATASARRSAPRSTRRRPAQTATAGAAAPPRPAPASGPERAGSGPRKPARPARSADRRGRREAVRRRESGRWG